MFFLLSIFLRLKNIFIVEYADCLISFHISHGNKDYRSTSYQPFPWNIKLSYIITVITYKCPGELKHCYPVLSYQFLLVLYLINQTTRRKLALYVGASSCSGVLETVSSSYSSSSSKNRKATVEATETICLRRLQLANEITVI